MDGQISGQMDGHTGRCRPVSPALSTGRTWAQQHPNGSKHSSHPHLGSQMLFLKGQGSSEPWLFPGLEHRRCDMSPQRLSTPERRSTQRIAGTQQTDAKSR